MVDFADALLRPGDAGDEEGAHTPPPTITTTPKLIRKRKLLTADSETEISKKDYSNHLKDTSHILRKVTSPWPSFPPLPRLFHPVPWMSICPFDLMGLTSLVATLPLPLPNNNDPP